MAALKKYQKKRTFSATPEPKGTVKPHGKGKLRFVIHEHHASHLHYDLRLELDGVLKSWAIPKGPSLDPHEHHLAIAVEDHPYDYKNFEGVIPKDNYGAGSVIIWDEGTYEPYHDKPSDEDTVRSELKKGHLTFILHGTKLQGEFALIKMKGQDEKSWLLVKKKDAYASSKDVTKQNTSVKSGKTAHELEEGDPDPLLAIKKFPKKSRPWRVTPMLCTLIEDAFSKEGWLFEMKWDGFRAIASKHSGAIELYSRNGNSFMESYPPIAEALRELTHDAILDGEIVVTDDTGTPHFEALQNWKRDPKGRLEYYIFDIIWYDGHDIREMPLIERKTLLKTILPSNGPLRFSDHVETHGDALFKLVEKRKLEGIVAKKADSPYKEGNRGAAWLKIKTHLRQEVVIGGFTEPRGSREFLGSLIVGVYKDGELHYVGHSGGGIPDSQRKLLRDRLSKIERKTSPFVVAPKPNAPVHWVQPKLVCEMSFSEWTSEGSMRQPKYEGLRADKDAKNVHKEIPKNIKKGSHGR